MLDKVLKIGVLFDFYGALLTDKQRQCVEMHYLNDFSLAEIALEFAVSRQAVHDILKRAEQILFEYEDKLGLAKRNQRQQHAIQEAYELLNRLKPEEKLPEIKLVLDKLSGLLDNTKEA
ncbi:MAG: YlxM family DNA-binding protein [Pelosinus sp.]|nr:YlxM family DNA-binding protein [Pelosinus sp.]